MDIFDLVILVLLIGVALSVGMAARGLTREARAGGSSRLSTSIWAVLGSFVFLVVMVVTAVAIARIVGGPGAADDCAGDECDANMGPAFAFLFLGLPAGIATGWIATAALRRLYAVTKRR